MALGALGHGLLWFGGFALLDAIKALASYESGESSQEKLLLQLQKIQQRETGIARRRILSEERARSLTTERAQELTRTSPLTGAIGPPISAEPTQLPDATALSSLVGRTPEELSLAMGPPEFRSPMMQLFNAGGTI